MSLPRSTLAKYDAKTIKEMQAYAAEHSLEISCIIFDHPNVFDERTIDEKYWDFVYRRVCRQKKEQQIERLHWEIKNGVY